MATRQSLNSPFGAYAPDCAEVRVLENVPDFDFELAFMQNAMRQPEKYRNLIVRVGGFSARFVELSPAVQLDILKRTLIE